MFQQITLQITYVQTIDDYASVPYLYSQLYTLLLLLNFNSLVYIYTHSFQLIRVVARKTVEIEPHVGRHLPRPAQARVAPAQGENGASPLRKIRERQKMGLRGSDQNGWCLPLLCCSIYRIKYVTSDIHKIVLISRYNHKTLTIVYRSQ